MNGLNLMMVQGGGPTQVLNATLAAVIEEARKSGGYERVLGARGGTKGLVDGNVADLSRMPENDLALLRMSPGAALGSSRFRPSREDMGRIIDTLQRLRVKDLLFTGGNGTMYGAAELLRHCRDSGCEIGVLGLPKTVDNDIAATDRCPGYASAARYVAQSTRDLGADVRSLPQPVSILETMGRSVGWLAAASVAGKRNEGDAPHVVCLPEAPFAVPEFISAVENAVAKRGWAVAVVSEGTRYADGKLVYQQHDPTQADPLNRPLTGGVGQYLADEIAARLKIRCRCEKPGLLGRASRLHISCQDLKDAELVGRAGVRALLDGHSGEMVSLLPLESSDKAGYDFVALDRAAGVERHIPGEWIGDGPIPVKTGFFDYIQPLVGELLSCYAPISADLDFHGEI